MSLNHIVSSNNNLDLLSVHFKNLVSDELDVVCGDNSTLIINPPTAGSINQVLVSDGAGGLVFATLSGGTGITHTGTPPVVGQHLKSLDNTGTFYENSSLVETSNFDFGNKDLKTTGNINSTNNTCTNLSVSNITSNIDFKDNKLNNVNEGNFKNVKVQNTDSSIISYKLPTSGNNDEVLTSNGDGTLKWTSPPAYAGIAHVGSSPQIGQYAIYNTTSGDTVGNSRLRETTFDLSLDGLNIINNNNLTTNNLFQLNTDSSLLNFKLPNVGLDLQYMSSDGKGNVKWITPPEVKTLVDYYGTIPAPINYFSKFYDVDGNIYNSSVSEAGGNVNFSFQNLTDITTTNTTNLNVNSVSFPSTIPADIKSVQDKTQNITATLNNTTFTGTVFGTFNSGGTNVQYVSGDGSLVTPSNSQQSNIYLYRTQINSGIPPPANGRILYALPQSLIVGNSNTLYINHLTDNNIDVENFLYNISISNQIYIQDRTISGEYQIWDVSGAITIFGGSYIQVPVLLSSGTHIFLNNHAIIMAVLLNTTSIDARLNTLESRTQNQTASSLLTTFNGQLDATTFVSTLYSGSNYFLKSNGTVDTNTYALSSSVSNINLQSEGLGTYSLIGSTSSNPNFRIKSLNAGSNITITDALDVITINSTGGGGGTYTFTNAGTGTTLVANTSGINDFKTVSITAGANVAISNSGTDLVISASGASGTNTINVTSITASASTYYPLFSSVISGNLSTISTDGVGLSYIPADNKIIVGAVNSGIFTSNITPPAIGFQGHALSSSQIQTTGNPSSASTFYPTFVATSTSATSEVLNKDVGLSYRPSDNKLMASVFEGTTFQGTGLISTISFVGTATNAGQISTTANPTSTSLYYPTFVATSSTNNNEAVYKDVGFSYRPSDNSIFCDNVNAITFTSSTAIASAGFIGTSSQALKIAQTAIVASASIYYPVFSPSSLTSTAEAMAVESTLTYQPSTNTLTAGTFVGNLTGTASNVANIAGGTAFSIPYQSAVGTTTFLANGSVNQILISRGAGLSPQWTSASAIVRGYTVPFSSGGTSAGYQYAQTGMFGIVNTSGTSATTTKFICNVAGSIEAMSVIWSIGSSSATISIFKNAVSSYTTTALFTSAGNTNITGFFVSVSAGDVIEVRTNTSNLGNMTVGLYFT
jgi:hypothetical protein